MLIREILRLSLGLQNLYLQNLSIMSATSEDHQDVNCPNSLVRDIIIHTLRSRNMVPMNNKQRTEGSMACYNVNNIYICKNTCHMLALSMRR